jgi:hypothetical protein
VEAVSAFWDDLADEMQDAEFCALFLESLALIEALDRTANATLDQP